MDTPFCAAKPVLNAMVKNTCILLLAFGLSCGGPQKKENTPSAEEQAASEMPAPDFFELRTYYCPEGKLPVLLERFEDHTMALFEKHGMVNIGYWLPVENTENKLVYLLGYPGRAERDASWNAFMEDPQWQKVWEASRVDGPVVDSVKNVFLTYTDYSPEIPAQDAGPRIFSLRTYVTHPGKLPELHTRFRDHTMEIFENNGITNVAYFNLDAEEAGSDRTLMYFVTFPDTTARLQRWKSFGQDPAWRQAYEASIQEGPLVDSITAEILVPTAFSPLK